MNVGYKTRLSDIWRLKWMSLEVHIVGEGLEDISFLYKMSSVLVKFSVV